MDLIRCNRGHFFDCEKHTQCPHCSSSLLKNEKTTVLIPQQIGESKEEEIAPLSSVFSAAMKNSSDYNICQEPIFEEKSVSSQNNAEKLDPVVGWFVCVEGNNYGKDFKIKSGRNFIGRSSDMDIALMGDDSVARERHAAVIFEPRALKFLIQPGDAAKELCYLNDEVVVTAVELKVNDVLTVGESKLMFFPCCNEVFNWDQLKKQRVEKNEQLTLDIRT